MEITEYINSFLEGKLSPDELIEFEKKRINNKEFCLEVDAQIKIYEVADRAKIKSNLKDVEEDLFHDKTYLIDSYINGNIQEDFKYYFDARIEIDDDFRLEIESQKEIRKNMERSSIKEQLKGVETDIYSNRNTPKKRILKLIVTYSSIAAILIIGFFVIKNSTSNIELLSQCNIYVIGSSGSMGFVGTDSLFVDIKVYADNVNGLEYEFQNKELKIYIPLGAEFDTKQEIKLEFNSTEDIPYMLEFNSQVYNIDITKKRKRLE